MRKLALGLVVWLAIMTLAFLVVTIALDRSYLTDKSRWQHLWSGEPGKEELLALFESIDADTTPHALTTAVDKDYPNLFRPDLPATRRDDYIVVLQKTSFFGNWWTLVIEFDGEKIASAEFRHLDHESIPLDEAPAAKVFSSLPSLSASGGLELGNALAREVLLRKPVTKDGCYCESISSNVGCFPVDIAKRM